MELLLSGEHETTLYSHHRPCDKTRYLTNAQDNTAQLRENESYRKNEDSGSNSYTLIRGQVVGSDGDQYVKSSY